MLVDPFCEGMRISAEECEERLRHIQGEGARLSSDDVVAAGTKQILVRILNNLRLVYLETEDYSRALAAVDRILLIVGPTPKLRRDRGLLFARLQIYGKAWPDLAAYLRSDEARSDEDSGDQETALLRAHFERVRHLAAAPN
jgi:regulator of sirC expression with transglutaminase-like and TPR domain